MIDKNRILNLSEFFSGNIAPTVLGAFLRRSEYVGNRYVFAYFRFLPSKFCPFDNVYYQNYVDCINANSGDYPYWQVNMSEKTDSVYISSKYKGVYILKNDLGINLVDEHSGNNFINRLINKIRRETFLSDYSMTRERNDFIRGYFDVATSYDGADFFASDYYINSHADVRKIMILMEFGLISPEYFNFNPRLTENTTHKADQFRVSWKYYLHEIGTYSKYRMKCICNSDSIAQKLNINENRTGIFTINIDYADYDDISRNNKAKKFINKYYTFVNMAQGYRINGEADDESIRQYRQLFGLDKSNDNERRNARNSRIVKQVYETEPDLCVCCQNRYNIKDRSFKKIYKLHGMIVEKYYFEMHHAISFSNGKNCSEYNVLDVVENIVKVCPTCHACLTAKKGLEADIKQLIINMLDNSAKVRNFTEGYFGTDDEKELVEKIYEILH